MQPIPIQMVQPEISFKATNVACICTLPLADKEAIWVASSLLFPCSINPLVLFGLAFLVCILSPQVQWLGWEFLCCLRNFNVVSLRSDIYIFERKQLDFVL